MSVNERGVESRPFPPFDHWKASLDAAFHTKNFPGYVKSLSLFERWYVPVRTADVAFPDLLVYNLEKIVWHAGIRKAYEGFSEASSIKSGPRQALRALMNSIF